MRVKPMLGDWEVLRIASIHALEHRSWVELAVPGRVGSVFQDLNTTPTRIAIRGSLQKEEERDEFIEQVREKFRAGEPVTFVADILTATEVQYVIVETLRFEESGERPDELDYLVILRESPPPPPPPDPLGGIDTGLLDQAQGLVDAAAGALDAISALGSIPDFGDPTPPIRSAMDQVRTATTGVQEAAALLGGLFEDEE
ncbi:MAG TPA: hypothetical protein VFZ18_15380 [Longimicrobiaceae bacterium]|jgi:hypothetical protein